MNHGYSVSQIKLLVLSEEEQKIVFRVLDVASEYYYNLLDILKSKYKPHTEYREKCSEILFHGQTGRFYLINDEGRFNLWKANLSEGDYDIIPSEIFEIILKNTSIKPTNNSHFNGESIEVFFNQLGKKTSVLINNTDLEKAIQHWDSSLSGARSHYMIHVPIDIENLNLESFTQEITEYVVEGIGGVDLSETMLTALNTDSFDEFKQSMSEIQSLLDDPHDEMYSALFYFLLDNENVDIKLFSLSQLLDEQDYTATETLDVLFTSKIISLGKEFSVNLDVIRDVNRFLDDLNRKYSKLVERYVKIYHNQFHDSGYYDPITKTNFYPKREAIFGDVEDCTKENLRRDINRVISRKIELEEKVLAEWYEFILPKIINKSYSDKESKILAIQANTKVTT